MSDTKTETVPVSVRLPADLVNEAARVARENFTSVTALVGQGLRYVIMKDRIAKSAEYAEFLDSLKKEATVDRVLSVAEKAARVPAALGEVWKVDSQ